MMPFFDDDEFFGDLLLMGAAGGGGSVVQETATGNPLTFQTDLAKPLKSLLVPFLPVQSGSGDPSPQNIRSILPWNGLSVFHAGKNLVDKTQLEDGLVWWQGNKLTGYANNCASPKIPVVPGATYFRQGNSSNQNSVSWFDKNGDYISQESWGVGYAKTIPANAYFAGMTFGKDYKDEAMLFVGNTATAYEPYVPITETDISFPSPVYGGTLDVVAGVLTVTHVMLDLHKSDFTQSGSGAMPYRQTSQAFIIQHKPKSRVDWNLARQQQKMNCAKIANPYGETAFGEYIGVCLWDTTVPTTVRISQSAYDALQDNDIVSICYEIDDPFEITLTPEQITAIKGNNTIWSDANGEMTAVYLKKG